VGATTLIPVEEYLSSVYEPEMDYVDGVLEDRNVGEKDHSKLQRKLIPLIPDSFASFPAVRIRVAPTRFRVPDIACTSRNRKNRSSSHPRT